MPRISTASPRASRNTRNGPSPLQTRLSALLREARWILFAALAAWLTLVLATWSPSDPGWSHSVPAGAIHNRGGTLGAYLADILLYLFGFSAWWWVVLLLHRVRAGYRRLASHLRVTNRKQPEVLAARALETGIGFFLLLIGSLGMEALLPRARPRTGLPAGRVRDRQRAGGDHRPDAGRPDRPQHRRHRQHAGLPGHAGHRPEPVLRFFLAGAGRASGGPD